MGGMPGERRGIWEELVRLYWASALAVGVVALVLELALGVPSLLLLGALYLAVTLLLARLRRVTLHLYYALFSTLAMLHVVPRPPLAGDPALFAAAILVLVTLAAGVYGGPLGAAGAALLATLVFPGLDPYPRVALFSVHALAAYIGVRIRGWLAELERVQDRLDWVAHHDPLTGLGNRRALEAAFAEGGWGYLSLWDLDGLKAINDREGHAAGDAELRRLAEAFRAEARGEDRFFRTGGDEFVGLHRGERPPRGLVERVRRRFPRVSVGLAPVAGTLEAAIAEADRAMYRDKAGRRTSG